MKWLLSQKKRSSAGKNQIRHHKRNHKSQILSAPFKRKLGNFHPPIDYCQVSSTNTNTEHEQNTLSSSSEWPPGWEYLLKSLLYRCQEYHTLYKSNALLSSSFRHLLMALSAPRSHCIQWCTGAGCTSSSLPPGPKFNHPLQQPQS